MDDRRGHVYDGEDCVDKGRVPIAGFIGLVRTGFLDGFLDANLQQLKVQPSNTLLYTCMTLKMFVNYYVYSPML